MASKIFESITQTDVSTLSYRATCGFNECIYLAANEPSLGLYRIQEHVQNSVPKLVQQKQALQELCERVDGAGFDLEYDSAAVKEMSSVTQFAGLSVSIERAVELKRALEERERGRRDPVALRNYGTMTSKLTPATGSSINNVHADTDLKPKSFD